MDEGEGFPHRDSSQRDVHQPQEYQIRGMRIIQRVHFAWKRVQYLFNSGNQETVSPSVLATICLMAFATQIRVIGEKG